MLTWEQAQSDQKRKKLISEHQTKTGKEWGRNVSPSQGLHQSQIRRLMKPLKGRYVPPRFLSRLCLMFWQRVIKRGHDEVKLPVQSKKTSLTFPIPHTKATTLQSGFLWTNLHNRSQKHQPGWHLSLFHCHGNLVCKNMYENLLCLYIVRHLFLTHNCQMWCYIHSHLKITKLKGALSLSCISQARSFKCARGYFALYEEWPWVKCMWVGRSEMQSKLNRIKLHGSGEWKGSVVNGTTCACVHLFFGRNWKHWIEQTSLVVGSKINNTLVALIGNSREDKIQRHCDYLCWRRSWSNCLHFVLFHRSEIDPKGLTTEDHLWRFGILSLFSTESKPGNRPHV